MRKAIADTTLVSESEAMDESEASRRQRLEVAVNNDDWSSVIDSQTQETNRSLEAQDNGEEWARRQNA